MADSNRYEPTAARKRGKPGREIAAEATTIDMHAHVAVPRAGEIVKPHLDPSTVPLDHFSTPETKALDGKAGRRHPQGIRARQRPTSACATWTTWASTCSSSAAAAAVLLHRAGRHRGEGDARAQRRHRRICRQASPTAWSRSAACRCRTATRRRRSLSAA